MICSDDFAKGGKIMRFLSFSGYKQHSCNVKLLSAEHGIPVKLLIVNG